MPPEGHVISTGADGVLVGMTPDEVTAVMNRALQSDRLVMHFHGGLVDTARGMKVAEGLLPVYAGAGAYPVFFVWRAGALEIVRHNVLEIGREELFERLLRRVLDWAVGKVRGEEEGGRGGPMQWPSPGELDKQLGARKRAAVRLDVAPRRHGAAGEVHRGRHMRGEAWTHTASRR